MEERTRPQEVLTVDQIGKDGLIGREAECGHAAAGEDEGGDAQRRGVAGAHEDGQQAGEDHLADGRPEQQETTIDPVGDGPADRGQHPDGNEGGGGDQAGPSGLAGELGDQDAHRHRLQPRADVGHQRCAPDEGEIPPP